MTANPKVLFDIALVGLGVAEPSMRTGVFRYCHKIAVALASRPDISLELCATRKIAFARRALDKIDELRGVPLLIPASSHLRQSLYPLLEEKKIPRPNVDPRKVVVTYPGVSEKFHRVTDRAAIEAAASRAGLPSGARYILSLCTLETRKNLGLTIKAFSSLRPESRRGAFRKGGEGVGAIHLESLCGRHGFGLSHRHLISEGI